MLPLSTFLNILIDLIIGIIFEFGLVTKCLCTRARFYIGLNNKSKIISYEDGLPVLRTF